MPSLSLFLWWIVTAMAVEIRKKAEKMQGQQMHRWEDPSLLCGSWESSYLQYSWRSLGLSQILVNTTTSLFTVSSILMSVCSLQITFLPTDDLLFPPPQATLACPSPLGSTFMDSDKRKRKCPLHYVPNTLHSPWHSIICSINKLTTEWSLQRVQASLAFVVLMLLLIPIGLSDS